MDKTTIPYYNFTNRRNKGAHGSDQPKLEASLACFGPGLVLNFVCLGQALKDLATFNIWVGLGFSDKNRKPELTQTSTMYCVYHFAPIPTHFLSQ